MRANTMSSEEGRRGCCVLRHMFISMSVLTMALAVVSDLLLDMQMSEWNGFAALLLDWMLLAFPNSLYFLFIPIIKTGWIGYFHTVAIFSLLITPLSYLTGLALEKVRRRVGFLISAALYAAISFVVFWLVILHVFQIPWREVFS